MSIKQNLKFSDFNKELNGDVEDDSDRSIRLQLISNETALHKFRLDSQPGEQLIAEDGITVLCVQCGVAIPTERLAVLPLVEFCVDCQSVIELKKKRENHDNR